MPLRWSRIRRCARKEIEDVGGKLFTKVRGVVTEVGESMRAGVCSHRALHGYLSMVIVRAAGGKWALWSRSLGRTKW